MPFRACRASRRKVDEPVAPCVQWRPVSLLPKRSGGGGVETAMDSAVDYPHGGHWQDGLTLRFRV